MTQDWKETLQSEIIEHYVFLAEMKQHAKDRTGHMVEMREQWEKLCSFIGFLLKEQRLAVLEEVEKEVGILYQPYEGEPHIEYHNKLLDNVSTIINQLKVK